MGNVVMVEDLFDETGEYRPDLGLPFSNGVEHGKPTFTDKMPCLMRWLIDSGAVTGIMTGPLAELPDGTTLESRSMKTVCGGTLKEQALTIRDELLKLIEEGKSVYLYVIASHPSTLSCGTLDLETFKQTYTGDLVESTPWVRVRAAIV